MTPNARRTAAAKRKAKPLRQAYLESRLTCDVCMKRRPAEVHEIARGVHRMNAIAERCCWLAVCKACHAALGDYSLWPISRQLAAKLLADPEHFDREHVNEIRGRAANAISMSDVVVHLYLKGTT